MKRNFVKIRFHHIFENDHDTYRSLDKTFVNLIYRYIYRNTLHNYHGKKIETIDVKIQTLYRGSSQVYVTICFNKESKRAYDLLKL